MTRYVVLLACLFGTARADVEVSATVKAPDPKQAPQVEATIIGGPKLPADKIWIAVDGQPKSAVHATSVRDYAHGTETLALALVVEGQEVWIGNDDIEKDPTAKYAGALKGLAKAIDGMKLGASSPRGSKGLVVTYSAGAQVKVPLGDIKNITGAALGTQKDYSHKLGSDLVQGVTLALAELSKVTASTKIMIVVGDGNDTNPAAAKAALAELKKQAAQQHIEVRAVVWKSAISDLTTPIATLDQTVKVANSVDGIAAHLNAIAAHVGDRYYATFPGYDAKAGTGLEWDGKPHKLVVTLDKTALEPFELTLTPRWAPPTKK